MATPLRHPPTMYVVDTNRVRVVIFRVPEDVLNQVVLLRGYGAHAFHRLTDAKASACGMADGRRVMIEQPNGTFRPIRCRGGR